MLGWHGKKWGKSYGYEVGGGNATFSDVTSKCSVEWHQEPLTCYPYLIVSGTQEFTLGEVVIGSDSNAQATVYSSYVEGDRVYLQPGGISGEFTVGETVTGQSSGVTATVNCFLTTRSYPNNITQGRFPSSIFSKTEFLEFESTLDTSGFVSCLKITFSESGLYKVVCSVTTGDKIDNTTAVRYVKIGFTDRNNVICGGFSVAEAQNDFVNTSFLKYFDTPFTYVDKDKDCCVISFYQTDKGTFNWRLNNVKVLFLGG